MKDFLLIIKNTILWLGIFSLTTIISIKLNYNFLELVIVWLIIMEILIFFSPKDSVRVYLDKNYVHNYLLNFIIGIICFSLFFFKVLDEEFFSEIKPIYLGILYIVYEIILFIRSFLYEKRFLSKKYYKGVDYV